MAEKCLTNGRSFYISARVKGGKKFFRLRWRVDKTSKEKQFPIAEMAKQYARDLAKRIPAGSLGLVGKNALEYQTMQEEIPEGWSIYEVFHLGMREVEKIQEKEFIAPRDVMEVIDEYIEQKTGSKEYVRVLRNYLRQFSKAFSCPMKEVTPQDIQLFLENYPKAKKTISQMSGYLHSFFKWAQETGNYPKVELKWSVEKPVAKEVQIYSIEEARKLLNLWPKDELKPIVIQMFAGLRSSEVERLNWSDIREDGIIVMASNSKTKRRRVASMLPVLKAWLDDLERKESGPVINVSADYIGTHFAKVAKACGFNWKKNALRHSFCSYRLAATKDSAATAYEAGHTVADQKQNYDAVVTQSEGMRWFEMMP